jgi:hypothetical protein
MEEITKPITNVTINYEDGTQSKLEYFAVIGLGDNTWYDILSSPPDRESRVKMNNQLVDLSNKLIESIGM